MTDNNEKVAPESLYGASNPYKLSTINDNSGKALHSTTGEASGSRRNKRSKLPLVLTWGASLAAIGLIALTLLYTQSKVAESQARLLPPDTAQVELDETANAKAARDVSVPDDERLALAAPRVTVLPVEAGSYQTTIQAFGEVKARTTLTLSSESMGRVEWIAPEFTVGGRVKAGAKLLQVSDRNYLTAQANAEQELANARQESVLAQQELSNAYQEMAAAEQESLNAKQGIPNAYQSNASAAQGIASADQGIASADQGIASADKGIASANQGVASAQQAIASAQQELSASYHEIASAEQALKQELDQARTANQPWNGQDAVASAQQEVQNALLAVKQEKAQALLAQEDWKRAGMKGRPSELASRQPQLAAANARFQAAKLALQKAQYELQQQGGELAQRKPQIKATQARLTTAKTRLAAAKAGLITAKKQAVTAQKEVANARKQAVTARKQAITAEKQVIAAKAQANASRGNINIAQAHIKTARARMNSAKAKVKSAKARIATAGVRFKTAQVALEKAAYDLSSTVIRAPFDALIGSKTVAVGSYVTAGASLGELRASDAAEVTLALSMQQASQLQAGQGIVVELRSDEYPDAVWQGEVDRIADYIEPTTRTRNVVVRVDQPLEQATPLLTGSFVSATLQGKERTGLLKIPSSALAADGFLWFVDDSNKLQRIARTVAFSQDGALFVAAPDTTKKLDIVRWPLAGYLPGMAVTPAAEPTVADSEQAANAATETSMQAEKKSAQETAQLNQLATTGAAL